MPEGWMWEDMNVVTGQTAREPRPNLYSGRMRLYLSRTDYDTPQDYLL
jgi:hypothetical protein